MGKSVKGKSTAAQPSPPSQRRSLLGRMLFDACLLLLLAAPFAAGAALIHPHFSDRLAFAAYLTNYAIYVGLFLGWFLFRRSFVALAAEPEETGRRSKLAHRLSVAAGGALVVIGLQLFRLHFDMTLVYAAVLAIWSSSMAVIERKFFIRWAFVFELACAAFIGWISFGMLPGERFWQSAIIAVGIACMVTLPELARRMLTRARKAELRPPLRAYALVLFSGPTCIAVLVYLRQLPSIYLVLFAIVPYARKALNAAFSSKHPDELPEWFLAHTYGISIFYVAIMIALGFVV